MKKSVMTIQITTTDALEQVLSENASVLYVSAALYLSMHSTIHEKMASHGFAQFKVCRCGVIFAQTQGLYKFDPKEHTYALPPVESL